MSENKAESNQQERGGRWSGFKREVGTHWLLICFTNVFAFIFGFTIVWLCWKFAYMTTRQPYEFLLVSVLGAMLGWFSGMLFVPYDAIDEKRFSKVAGALSAFVSGYAFSKLDKLLDSKVDDLKVADDYVWMMLGLFFCSIFLAFLTVYSNRSYHGK